jgi:tetratricopeptide (TPR) repeat protein
MHFKTQPRRILSRRILPSAGRRNLAVAGSLACLLLGVLPAVAATAPPLNVDQATQLCRESVGKPAFQACMQARTKAGGGSPEQYRDACIASARPAVQACVAKSTATAGRDKQAGATAPAVSAPKDLKPVTTKKDLKPVAAEKDLKPVAAKGDLKPVATEKDLKPVTTENVGFVAPPRSARDVMEILDREKPDPGLTRTLTAQADAAPPPDLKGLDLAQFYYTRAQARGRLGRVKDAIADTDLAIENAPSGADYPNVVSRYEQFLTSRLRLVGQTRRAMEIVDRQVAVFSKTDPSRLLGLCPVTVGLSLEVGDTARAEGSLARCRSILTEMKTKPDTSQYFTVWSAKIEETAARIAEARGRLGEAGQGYERAAKLYRQTIPLISQWRSSVPAEDFERASDSMLASAGRMRVKAGRIGEGEANIRRALLSRLSKAGKFNADTAAILGTFAFALQEQGRNQEAEKIQREVIGIYKGLGYAEDSSQFVNAHLSLAGLLSIQHHYDEAGQLYEQADGWTWNWEPGRRDAALSGLSRIVVSFNQGKPERGLETARRTYERARKVSGDAALDTVVARGFMAVALYRNGHQNEAYRNFREAIPLLANANRGDADSGSTAAAIEERIRLIVETYFSLLSRNPQLATGDAALETLAYSDLVRGESVQRALQASSVRAVAQHPGLADLVRVAQDTDKRLGAALATENNLLSLPSNERNPKALREVQAQIVKLRAVRAQSEKDIAQKFPDYGNLTKPVRPSADAIKAALADDEALLSFYFGRSESFVWVVSKSSPVKFARIALSAAQLDSEVAKLREALEPKADMISDIPPFDVKRAYALYEKLLKPVESALKPARSLVVVTNGALGLLPLSLLPTAPAEVARDDDPLFSSYRKVPWLARTHAVSLMPSAAALITIRKLPAAKPDRSDLVAFGDPFFKQDDVENASAEKVRTADAANVTRGVPLKRRSSPQLEGVGSADLAMLPRLPDTADELKTIAAAMKVDPNAALHLGKDANEQAVKSMDLSKVKARVCDSWSCTGRA